MAAIKAAYQTRLDAMRNYDGPAYVATFAPDFTSSSVTSRSTSGSPSDTVKRWPKPGVLNRLAGAIAGQTAPEYSVEILGSHSDGADIVVTVAWYYGALRRSSAGGLYYFYRDYVSEDRWERSSGRWVQKSGQLTVDKETWSLHPIPLSERKLSQT